MLGSNLYVRKLALNKQIHSKVGQRQGFIRMGVTSAWHPPENFEILCNGTQNWNCIITLLYLIAVQDRINVQDGKILKINKRAGWNKAVQVGIFQKLLL